MTYLFSLPASLALGLVSIFFAFGGLARRKLFFRLLRRKGRWWQTWAVMLCISVVCGIYGIWLFGGLGRTFFSFALLNCYLLSMAATDLRGCWLPDDAAIFFAMAFLVFQASALSLPAFVNALLGGALGGALLGLPHLLRKNDVGLGDVKMAATAGLMLGFPSVLYVLVRAMLLMALFGVVQLARKKVALKSQIPLAPFFFLGALI